MDKEYGDILSYRPNIKYSKGEHITKKELGYDDDKIYKITSNYTSSKKNSPVIEDIKTYLPNYIFNDIQQSINDIKGYLHSIEVEYGSKKINDIELSKYISKIKNNEITSYKDIQEHIDDKKSSSYIEVYLELSDELNYLEDIKNTYLEINYSNKDITIEESEEKDNVIIRKLEQYEGTDTEKINYLSLSIDSKVNMILQGFAEGVNIYSQDLFYLLPMDRKHEAPNDKDVIVGLARAFEDLSKYNLTDLSKLHKAKNKNNIVKILKHINNSKVELSELSDTISKLSSDSNDYAVYVDSIFMRKTKEIETMVLDLFKEVSLLCAYKDDYSSTLIQKEYLRKVFLKF